MVWKLGILATGTLLLILAVIPYRTHAVKYDLGPGDPLPQPTRMSLRRMIANMYLTPGSVVLILAIAAAATFLALLIIRAG